MPDEQDRAEMTDDDKLGGEFPPERPLGAHRRQDDAIPESFAGRQARTNPEVDDAEPLADDGGTGAAAPVDSDEALVAEAEVVDVPEAAEEAALHLRDDGPR